MSNNKFVSICTKDNFSEIDKLKNLISECDSVVIGAGSGLSSSAGLMYSGERFNTNFADFIAKYGFTDMYSAGFYPFKTLEERWAYWSRHIYHNRYAANVNDVYNNLLNIVKNKDYFVITTNVDHCFQKHGFDKTRLFYTQGDYGLWQCSVPCHEKTYDNETEVFKMVRSQQNMNIPHELIPYCPKCGKPMSMNLRADSTFVEDEGWHKACKNYENFIKENKDKKTLFLELGVGENTAAIIKHSFWRFAFGYENAVYVCANLYSAYAPKEIQNKAVCISGDLNNIISEI